MARTMMMILSMVILCASVAWAETRAGERLPLLSRHRVLKRQDTIPLDMAPNSVDDMYNGCTDQMLQQVNDLHLNRELVGDFSRIWNGEQKCVVDGMNLRAEYNLSEDNIRAICVYTGDDLYQEFNKAVRTQRSEYLTNFTFHAVHFFLTVAIQRLKEKQSQCFTTFRRTKDAFVGEVNHFVRFGLFASTSLDPSLTQFGTNTCFEIYTCFGADLESFPHYKSTEREVLIPPYERFKITNVEENARGCNLLYNLTSAETVSNLNCAVVN